MKPRLRFVHGKIINGIWCAYCDATRKARCIHECYKWRMMLACGHVVSRGYTLPPSELERKGYVNQYHGEDPRLTALKVSLVWDALAKRKEAKRKWLAEKTLAGTMIYR